MRLVTSSDIVCSMLSLPVVSLQERLVLMPFLVLLSKYGNSSMQV